MTLTKNVKSNYISHLLNHGTENRPVNEVWDIQLRHYNSKYDYFENDEHLPGHENTDTYWKERKDIIFIRNENHELTVVSKNERERWNPEFLGTKRFTLDERTNKYFSIDRSMISTIPGSNEKVNDVPRDFYEIIKSKPGILPPTPAHEHD